MSKIAFEFVFKKRHSFIYDNYGSKYISILSSNFKNQKYFFTFNSHIEKKPRQRLSLRAMFDDKENLKIGRHQTEITLVGPSLSVLSYFFSNSVRNIFFFSSIYLTPFDVGTYLRITIWFFVVAVHTWYLLSTESLALLPLLSSYFYD